MEQDTLDILVCASCRQPTFSCRCLPESFLCRECRRIAPLAESRKRRKSVDDRGIPCWTYYRAWQCTKCTTREKQRRDYRKGLKAAASSNHAALAKRHAHPLWRWVQRTRLNAANVDTLRRNAAESALTSADRAKVNYYEQYVLYLRAYADHLDSIVTNNLPYHNGERLSYPTDLKPSSQEIHARLPIDRRRELYRLAEAAGMNRTRALWGALNLRFPRSAPDSAY